MAQRVQVILEDDIDGGKAEETIMFGLDGAAYEIDLSTKNAKKLRDALSQYVGAGRRIAGRNTKGASPRRASTTGPDPKAVRAWAASQKIEVSERGRIPKEIVDKFLAANP